MGPRLFGRGNVLRQPAPLKLADASMGPRLFGRGNSTFRKGLSKKLLSRLLRAVFFPAADFTLISVVWQVIFL